MKEAIYVKIEERLLNKREKLQTYHKLWLLSSHLFQGGFTPFHNLIHVTDDSHMNCNVSSTTYVWPQTKCLGLIH